ncbi:MAG TPA: hypothetical protein VIY86_07395, partial [Pirellulaceae bacterium]
MEFPVEVCMARCMISSALRIFGALWIVVGEFSPARAEWPEMVLRPVGGFTHGPHDSQASEISAY